MSRLLIMVALCAVAPAAYGQQDTAALRARIDSLLPEYEAARVALSRGDSLREARKLAAVSEQLDSIDVPPFIVVARHSQSARVFEVARKEIAGFGDLLAGTESSPRITLLVQHGEEYLPFRKMLVHARHHIVWLPDSRAARVQAAMRTGIEQSLGDLLPAAVRAWLAGARWSKGRDERHVYRELATSETEIVRMCYRQDVASCAAAAELARQAAPETWYTTRQLRTFVAGKHGSSQTKRDCVERHDREACVELLSRFGGAPSPLSGPARATLLRFAVESGGPGALARMSGAATPAEAISAAARTELPAVLRGWRRHIQLNRPIANAGTTRIGFATLIWIALILALATRSTRERL